MGVLASVGGPDQTLRHSGERRDPTWGQGVAVFVVWTTSAIAVSIYLAQGGLTRAFSTPAAAVTVLGIASGLVATNLLVMMLLAVARIPIVDRLIGHDLTLHAHRILGPWVTGLLAVHMIALVIAWAMAPGQNLWRALTAMFATVDLLYAFVSLGLMAVVALTSIIAVRRKLGYEAWYLIHLLSYIAVGLSIPHQFTTGMVFAEGISLWYWAALLLATAFCLLAFRVILPIVTSLEQSFVVTRVIEEAPDVVSIVVRGKHVERLGAEAGQFFAWRFLAPGLWWHQHPFSLSAAPNGNYLRLSVRRLGDGSDRVMSVTPGTRVFVEGPYGRFRVSSARTSNLVLIGAGVGMAPIRALADEANGFDSVTVISRGSSGSQGLFDEELAQLCHENGYRYYYIDGHRGDGWLTRECEGYTLADIVPDIANADVFCCGPGPWTAAVEADALACGVAPAHFHSERFDW